ncbi:SRPBCC family protein [Paenibacillus hamazuiensis]|uniref:SRPBCC family protein n=1 Tax=Paenibacillus hamazuiensis TaxID=2936508 RepID=UPI00201089A4|nr:SRPBCC domain-containing protein [Paenibacillus hamazuiensis]
MTNPSQGTVPDIKQTIVLHAPIQKVWNSVATSEGIAAWFMPNTFEPELGKEFTLTDPNFGTSPCKVTELDPPRRLAFTWAKDWVITFELEEQDGKTQFTLIHSGWDADKVTEFGMPHPMVRERMNQGWSQIVLRLQKLVEA